MISSILYAASVPPEWGGISMGGIAYATRAVVPRLIASGMRVYISAYNALYTPGSGRVARYGNIEVLRRPGAYNISGIIGDYGISTLMGSFSILPVMWHLMRKYDVRTGIKKVLWERVILQGDIKYSNADILHIHIPNKSTLAVPFISDMPVVATVHKHHLADGMENERIILKMTIPYFDIIIAVSEGIKRELEALGAPSQSIRVIPNGVDTEKFHPCEKEEVRRKLGIPEDRVIVLFVGRLEPVKGVDILLDAWTMVERNHPEAMLYIIGDGSMRNSLEEQVKKNKLKNVIFTGAMDHDALPQWYSSADIFCSPSRSEAHPLTFLEAMASALPCIGPDISGVNEILRDGVNGLLHRPCEAKDLAEKLDVLITSDSMRREYASSAQSTAKKYSWNRMVKRLMDVYTEVLALHK